MQFPLGPVSQDAPSPSPITHTRDGERRVPDTDDEWRDWVSASRTRNFALGDLLADWLDQFGAEHGFVADNKAEAYDVRTQFGPYILRKGNEFEAAIMDHIVTLADVHEVHADPDLGSRDLDAAHATLEAMRDGVPLIYQGVLRDPETRTFGSSDLLVRSDYLDRLVPGTIDPAEAANSAPGLSDRPWHYRVIDVKFTTLHLLVGGEIGKSGSSPAYKVQLYIYNRALGRLQGYAPPTAYLLGRGWTQTVKGKTNSSDNAMDRLGPIAMDATLGSDADLAAAWLRRLRREGRAWSPLPEPTVPELRPDMTADSGFPWGTAKKHIAEQLQEPTLLWYVGKERRDTALGKGIARLSDPRLNPEAMGIKQGSVHSTIAKILEINHRSGPPFVEPERVRAAEDAWRPVAPVEFFVDFEFLNNVNDDFSRIPAQHGLPLIFMIGCGYEEGGKWVFRSFTTDALTEAEEARIIDDWLMYMREIASARNAMTDGKIIHWSFAEPVSYEQAYDSARNRHPEKDWPLLTWFDLWNNVFRAEPVVVQGALSFGLKAVAKAMHGHGLIETSWGDSQVDGLGAMVGAMSSDAEARQKGLSSMRLVPLMDEITAYNEVDCRVMWEILNYLRAHH